MSATDTDHEKNAAETPAANAGLRGALRFVVIFLVCTGVLLSASRYAVGSAPMNAYLFQVANHTSMVLRLFVYSSALEESASRRANAAGIRNTLTAWAEGEYVPESAMMATDPEAPPLTAYESWQFRVGQLNQEIESEREAIAVLRGIAAVSDTGSAQERLARLEADLAALEQSATRDGPGGTLRIAYPDFTKDTSAIRTAIEEGPGKARNSFTQGLADLEIDLARARDLQLAFLTDRLEKMENRLQRDTGPLVSLTLKAGLGHQLEDLRAELAAAEKESGKAAPELRAKIEALQAERAEADPAALRELDKDVSFRFSVVPDCGALPSMAIFVSAMLAFPTRWWKRLVGIAAGLPLLYAVNVLRLVCLGVIGAYYDGGEEFDFAHHFVWQGIYIVFVVAIWMAWVELMVKPGRAPSSAPAQ